MIRHSLDRLTYLIETIPPLLIPINEEVFKTKPQPEKWSKQEVLGHLIDSATNNHQRFVRAQFEQTPLISYNQNEWNRCSFYNSFPKEQLIEFWKNYNSHLLQLVKSTPASELQKKCNTGGPENYTIEFLFNDYVEHLEYHLKQIVSY